jgi:hypothetical protein
MKLFSIVGQTFWVLPVGDLLYGGGAGSLFEITLAPEGQ